MSETPMTPERRAEIAARVATATAGPWGFYDGSNYADVAADLTVTGRSSYSCRERIARLEVEDYWDDPAHENDDEDRASEQMAANAEFIAHAREDVPDLLADNEHLRARVAELEQREAIVAQFVASRAEYVMALRNCHPDNGHDYDRWQGHAAARRQLAELLGLPVAWPAEGKTGGAE